MSAADELAPPRRTASRRRREPTPRAAADPRRWAWRAGLALLLLVAFHLRSRGVSHGLPYVYNVDENAHFVPTAIGLFGHGWDPDYFVNPPAYTYLLHLVLLVAYGGREAVSASFASDPSGVFELARLTSAALGAIAVGLLYLAGARLFDRRVGMLAAGVLTVAFLPVFYGHLGLNDSPTLAPVCLALAGIAGVLRGGRRRDFAMAGVGLGLACATKYTGGIVLLALVAAAAHRRAWPALAGAGVLALVTFVVANPYAVLDFDAFWEGIRHQSEASGEVGGKLGLTASSGFAYYAWVLTWGLGWVPALAALGGAVGLWLRDRAAFWTLVPAVVAFLLFMGIQERYFGRWLMPILPVLCLLAAWAAVVAVDALAHRWPAAGPSLAAVAIVALCAQGVVASVHIGFTLQREDTRNQARAWMVKNIPRGTRVVVEPVVPDAWATDVGSASGARWIKWPGLRARFADDGRRYEVEERPAVNIEDYERTLQPELVDDYLKAGYCWVLSGSTQRGRAEAEPEVVPGAIAYYRRLEREAELVYRASPYRPGRGPVDFNFDWSFDFYPLAYERPGPVMEVYRLSGGECAA